MFESKYLPFFQTSPFTVRNRIERAGVWREPEIKIENEAIFICVRVAKLGYYGGNPDKVKKAPVDTVMAILAYEKFELEYKETAEEINNESK